MSTVHESSPHDPCECECRTCWDSLRNGGSCLCPECTDWHHDHRLRDATP